MRIPEWAKIPALVTGIAVVVAGGAIGGTAYRNSIVDIQTSTAAQVASVSSLVDDAKQAADDAAVAAAQAKVATDAITAAEEQQKATDAAAAAAAAQAAAQAAASKVAPKTATKSSTTTNVVPADNAPIACPAGSTVQAYDDNNNATACIPDICTSGIGGPGQPTNEQCPVFKP